MSAIDNKRARSLVLYGIALIATTLLSFILLDKLEKSEQLPMVHLTLTQAGCEALSQKGIHAIQTQSGCSTDVRLRKRQSDGWVSIEHTGTAPIEFSTAQIVSLEIRDDPHDEPWTTEHKQAFGQFVASLLLMLGIAGMMIRTLRR